MNPDKVWRISISEYRAGRSSEQNNRAWALYRAIAEETGHTPDEIHTICKAKFGEPKTVKMGEVEITEYSTMDKDVGWMPNYLTQAEACAATELGVMLGN